MSLDISPEVARLVVGRAGIAAPMFLWPPLATKLFPLILAADAAELALLLWLLVKGVDNSKWRALSA